MRTSLRVVVCALIVAIPAGAVAQPSNVDEARRHADAGQAALSDRQFQRALQEYQAAYDLFPNSLLLVNVARAQSGLGRNRDAIATLGRVLEDANLDPTRRAEVDAEIRRLRGLVAELTISVTPDGSRVRVNDEDAGESPLPGPVLAEPGRVEVVAAHDGYRPRRWTAVLEAGAERPVALALEPIPAAGDQGEEEEVGQEPSDGDIVSSPPPPEEHSNTLLWVSGVGGAVSGVAALTMGGILLGSCGSDTKNCDAFETAGGLRAYSAVADVLGGVAIVCAGVFVYALATSGDAEEAAATALASPGTVRF